MTIYKGHRKDYIGFEAGDDASELLTVSGRLHVRTGVTADAPKMTKVSHGVAVCGNATLNAESLTDAGDIGVFEHGTLNAPGLKNAAEVYVWKGGTLNAPNLDPDVQIFHEIACSGYTLFASQKHYKAGCRGPWTAEEALAHWDEQGYERGKIFAKAIKANEDRKLK